MKSLFRQFNCTTVIMIMILLSMLTAGCSHKYDPYPKGENAPPPDYPGRPESRFYPVKQYEGPPEVSFEENRLEKGVYPPDAELADIPARFEFPEDANYLLGPGDILEIIYQLTAEQRDQEYQIAIQDVLSVSFYYTPKLDREVTVRSDGQVSLPLIGDVPVYGKTITEVEKMVNEKYSEVLKDPEIDLSVVKSNWAIEELKRAITTAPRGQSRMEPVRPDGFISLPLVGDVKVAGKTIPEASSEIQAKYRDVGVEDIDVTVVLLEVRAPVAHIMGEVLNPGSQIISEREDVWRVIAMCGGFTDTADRQHVVVAKNEPEGEKRLVLDFDHWRTSLTSDQNTLIHRGDIIYVPRIVDQHVYILGAVEKPGRITLDSESRISASQMVAMGGRIDAGANDRQVLILRKSPDNEPVIIALDMKALFNPENYDQPEDYIPRDPLLQPGDIVYVPNAFIGDVNRFAEAYFEDGIWTIIPFNLNYNI